MSGFNVNGGKNVTIEYNTAFGNGEFGFAVMKDTVSNFQTPKNLVIRFESNANGLGS